jgi:3-dehydroquinate dehydratase II
MKILVLHGPNLDILHLRDPELYGGQSLESINKSLISLAQELGAEVSCVQSNHEGELIDQLNHCSTDIFGVILNPGGYTHTSVALADSVEATKVPVVEVHLSNIDAREDFRRSSLIGRTATGRISGLGPEGYLLALRWLVNKAQLGG